MGRSQTVDVLDANTNAVLDTRALTNFAGGVYLTWNITGHVKLRFTQTSSASNAVVSGIFFGAGVTIAATGVAATFVTTDAVTQGNWQSKYGADGFLVVDDSLSNPNYATVTPSLASDYLWSASTSDVRALTKRSVADRIAATWYSSSFFYVDLNITDHAVHQVAIYCLDWDSLGRAQTVDVLDAVTSALLDSRNISNFSGGVYLVWNVSGRVRLRVKQTSSNWNAVVSGIFFR